MPPLQPRDDALVDRLVGALAVEAVLVGDVHRAVARPVEDELLVLGLERLPGGVEVEAAELGHPDLQAGEVLAAGARPRRQRALGQRQGVVGHHELGVDLELGAEAEADRAGPVGRVEGEAAGGRLLEADAAVRAGEVLGEGDGLVLLPLSPVGTLVAGTLVAGALAVHDQHLGRAAGQAQRRLDGLGQALAHVGPADQAVHHDLDGVHFVPGQVDVGPLGQLQRHAVDPDPGEALLGQVVEQGAVLALAAPDHRRHDLESGALGQLEDPVDDLLGGLARHGPPADRAVGMADAGIQEAQVVVDLGNGPDGRARVAGGGLLVDGDGRGQPLDEVDVRLVHLAQELAGVGREGLDVAALALGVDGVEGQGGLPRARQAGEDDQPVPGQVERDITQVVLTSAANDETVGHLWRIPVGCVTSGRGQVARVGSPGRDRRTRIGGVSAPPPGPVDADQAADAPDAMPTMGWLSGVPPAEPSKAASP